MMMTTSTQMLFIVVIGLHLPAIVPVGSTFILQRDSCAAEVTPKLAFQFLEDDQCPVGALTLGEAQTNFTSVNSLSRAIRTKLKVASQVSKLVSMTKSPSKVNVMKVQMDLVPNATDTKSFDEKFKIKLQRLSTVQTTKTYGQKPHIKLQKPHKMRPQRRQIKVGKPMHVDKTQQSSPVKRKFQSLLKASGQVNKEELSLDLLAKLKETFRPGADHSRVTLWEDTLKPLYLSLPMNNHGNLGHAAARYVLHRGFVRRHGWSLKGLEPRNTSAPSNAALQEWVPTYLMDTIEQLVDTDGIDLQELAVIAATFEDIAHRDELRRLREVYEELNLPIEGRIKRDDADEVISLYMTAYTSDQTTKEVKASDYALGADTEKWLDGVQNNVTSSFLRLNSNTLKPSTKDLDFKTTGRIVEEIGEQYSNFNDFECSALKKTLLELEDKSKPGMVRLSDFYQKGMNQTYWKFREKIGYLRVLGALDESSSSPHVIIPNYVAGESNCLQRSGLYNVCCRSECESLMEKLEEKFQAPTAEPDEIIKLVAKLPSDTTNAPRSLSKALVDLLEGIAASNEGAVPLHSRDFAHWMHSAFPRECPVPHNSEKNPETPDEWLRESGEKSATATDEEMSLHVQSCSADKKADPVQKTRRLTTGTLPRQTRKLATRKVHRQARQLVTRRLSKKTHLKPSLAPASESPQMAKVSLGQAEARRESQSNVNMKPSSKMRLATYGPNFEDTSSSLDAEARQESESTLKPSSKFRLATYGPNFKGNVNTVDADVLFEASSEAAAYWDQEDRVVQPLDKEALPSIPQPVAPTEFTDRESRVSMTSAVSSSIQRNSALVILGLLLSFAVVHKSFSKPNYQKMKVDDPENPSHGSYDMNLVRHAAAASVRQRSQIAVTNDWV